jgi:hypothetical protein
MYTLNDKEGLLPRAVAHLQRLPDIKGRCLGYCRVALETIGLRLPPPQEPHSTALACYHALAADPARWGWQRVETPSAHPVMLAFFGNCGQEVAGNGDVIECGHVALKLGNVLYSSKDYEWGQYWETRLLGYFIPLA